MTAHRPSPCPGIGIRYPCCSPSTSWYAPGLPDAERSSSAFTRNRHPGRVLHACPLDSTPRSATYKSSTLLPNDQTGSLPGGRMEKVVGAFALFLYAITFLMYALIVIVPSTMP